MYIYLIVNSYFSFSHELIFEVNLAPSVNKMLSNCDDIIRQHKAACLRVTSLLACKDLIWVGTSAGVLLTIPAQCINASSPIPAVTGKQKQNLMSALEFKYSFFHFFRHTTWSHRSCPILNFR